jgi:hypothetical protein
VPKCSGSLRKLERFTATWQNDETFSNKRSVENEILKRQDLLSLSGLSDEQVRFAATHYAGCQKMTRRDADRLRSVNLDFIILHYRLGLALGYRSPDNDCQPAGDWLDIIDGDWVREWPGDDVLKEEWFYHYGGQRVFNCDWGWFLMNTDHSGWQEFWLSEILKELQDNNDDGLFADSVSVPNSLGADRFRPNLPAFDAEFEQEWSKRIERWITAVRTHLGARYRLIPNVGAWVTTRNLIDYSGADGVMIEGFSKWGPNQPLDPPDWKLQMNRILALTHQDRIILAQSYLNSADDIRSQLFYVGNYLLIKGDHTYLNMELSQEPEWFPEYSIPIGQPVEPAPLEVDDLRLSQEQVYTRRYTNGLVFVNLSNSNQAVALDRSYYQAVPSGGGIVPQDGDLSAWRVDHQAVDSVVIQPNQAVILLKARP